MTAIYRAVIHRFDPLGAPVCSQESSRKARANNTLFHNFLAVPVEQHWVERRAHIRHSKYVQVVQFWYKLETINIINYTINIID